MHMAFLNWGFKNLQWYSMTRKPCNRNGYRVLILFSLAGKPQFDYHLTAMEYCASNTEGFHMSAAAQTAIYTNTCVIPTLVVY